MLIKESVTHILITGIRYSRLPEEETIVMSGKQPAILIQGKAVFSLCFIYKYNPSAFLKGMDVCLIQVPDNTQ